jgi:hemin uptake protein HemP
MGEPFMSSSESPCDGCVREGLAMCQPPAENPGPEPAPQPSSSGEQRPVWRSDQLLGDHCEAIIEHRGQQYRLRCTKQGKLILYK